jgi:hypothetical protein
MHHGLPGLTSPLLIAGLIIMLLLVLALHFH